MFKNYFYLRRAVNELLPILLNAEITECYSQEKDKLYFAIPTNEFPNRHLIVSTNSTVPFIQIRENHHKAKKNVVLFFQKYLPAKFRNAEIAGNDRVIKFTFDNFLLFYFLRGNKSNIVLIDNNNEFSSFKHHKSKQINDINNNILSELINTDFSFRPKIEIKSNLNELSLDYSILKKVFPFIDKIIFKEISGRLRTNFSPPQIIDELNAAVEKVLNDNIAVFYDNFEGKSYFLPESFLITNSGNNIVTADNYNQAIQNLFRIKFKNERIKSLNNQLQKYFDKELGQLAHKLNNLSGRISKGSKELEYYKKGNLLLSSLNQIKKGFKEIELTDYETGSAIKIKLDDKFPPNKNVDKYFEKARDEKINYRKSKELFNITEEKYNSLLSLHEKFNTASTMEELEYLSETFKLTKNIKTKKKMVDNIKFRHYLIEDKYHVFVGKDSKSNDLLSTKFAKQNDYWFHARGLPGSHVVLRVDNTKEGVPKNIIKNAASIAGFYSKAKTAKVAPVSYTFAKYVYKKKGMEPGKVMISKEKVLLVKPEIPKNCEIVNDD